jgi:hypothetical protein
LQFSATRIPVPGHWAKTIAVKCRQDEGTGLLGFFIEFFLAALSENSMENRGFKIFLLMNGKGVFL